MFSKITSEHNKCLHRMKSNEALPLNQICSQFFCCIPLRPFSSHQYATEHWNMFICPTLICPTLICSTLICPTLIQPTIHLTDTKINVFVWPTLLWPKNSIKWTLYACVGQISVGKMSVGQMKTCPEHSDPLRTNFHRNAKSEDGESCPM